jgi:hypothetical protein
MKIAVLNQSRLISPARLDAAVRAVQRQLDRHVSPAWGFSASLLVNPKSTLGSWEIVVADDADQADARGYHDDDAGGRPRAFVFFKACREAGEEFSVALSHEVIELLGNPWVDACALGPDASRRLVAYELCDPVQGDTYLVERTPVSNFVLPSYFDLAGRAPYAHLGLLASPFEMTDGGCQIVWNHRRKWHDVAAGASRTVRGSRRPRLLKRNLKGL